MASLELDKLQPNGMFQTMVHSMLCDVLRQFGITVNGSDPADFQIEDGRVYYRLFKFVFGLDPLGFGECYMDGWWHCEDLTGLMEKLISKAPSERRYRIMVRELPKLMHRLSMLLFNMNTKSQSEKDISAHYDIGNDLYRLMLDRTMTYTCGYWQRSLPIGSTNQSGERLCESLEEAQINKMLLIGRKLKLQPGMRVLEFGCGWGYLAKFLAINFGVHVVAINISKEQVNFAKSTDLEPDELAFLRIPGLGSTEEGSFEFRLQDYREYVEGTFDRIVSIEMLEHVGPNNYNELFQICRRCLKDDGILLLETIGLGHTTIPQTEAWTTKYIFPGGCPPYHTQIVDASLNKFLIEDWHVFGYDYYRTLCIWKTNFDQNWPKLQEKYGERFRRMWHLYLCGAAASFKKRKYQLWQIVFSKKGLVGGYASCR